jgi:hypothetical protein
MLDWSLAIFAQVLCLLQHSFSIREPSTRKMLPLVALCATHRARSYFLLAEVTVIFVSAVLRQPLPGRFLWNVISFYKGNQYAFIDHP